MFKHIFSILFFFTFTSATQPQARTLPTKAVCVVPVANAFNEYVGKKFPTAQPKEISHLYHNVLAANIKDREFMRIHQFLLHEIVTVLEQHGTELLVQCSDHFCQNNPDEKVFNTYAVLAEEFLFLDQVKDFQLLPNPYEWYNGSSFKTDTIFTLKAPYTDPGSGVIFSLGTRFVKQTKRLDEVTVFVLQGTKMGTKTIPLSYGVINSPRTFAEKEACIVEQFMNACTGEKRIPTAFGGSSATAFFKKHEYEKTTLSLPDGTTVEGYARTQESGIQSGFTMPELNFTFDRMCGAVNIFKNTTTWTRLGTPLAPDQAIKNLDYICAKSGYLGRVISVQDNLIADIRSYTQHHGIARLVKLSENFKGIETYEDLVHAYHTNQPLQLWNDDQTKVIATFKSGDWKIAVFNPDYDEEKLTQFASLYH